MCNDKIQVSFTFAESGICVRHILSESSQKDLQGNIKEVVLDYLSKTGSPMTSDQYKSETVLEILSNKTVNHIKTLEELLEEIMSNTEDQLLAERIESVLC